MTKEQGLKKKNLWENSFGYNEGFSNIEDNYIAKLEKDFLNL